MTAMPEPAIPGSGACRSRTVRVHLTNVTGLGAVTLANSLLPALEDCPGFELQTLYLPDRGELAGYQPQTRRTNVVRRRRKLPNALSRFIECTIGSRHYDGDSPLLVLGDVPLRCRGRQTVFVQTTLLAGGTGQEREALKYRIARRLFRWNQEWASAFVVQSEAMRLALERGFPEVAGRVHVIPQPVPRWLEAHRGCRSTRVSRRGAGLRLFYPAADYPHKNHALLGRIDPRESVDWPVESLTLTIAAGANPNRDLAWLRCVGLLDPERVVSAYQDTDALLFLSLTESYGFPLVEAMWVGIPVVCPDLPYARAICGDGAIFFDPTDPGSLRSAIKRLEERLDTGWWPDWSHQLGRLPGSWSEVARMVLAITDGGESAPVQRNESK